MNALVRYGDSTSGRYGLRVSGADKIDPLCHDDAALKKACTEFETIFIESVMKAMRKTVPKDGLFSGGFGEDVFQELLDQEIACQIAGRGGLGIADMLYNQLNAKGVYSQG